MKAAQHFVCRVLQPRVRLVQLAGSLACQLAKLIPIGHVRKCPKNQIRAHDTNLLFRNESARLELVGAAGAAGKPLMQLLPQVIQLHSLDARHAPSVPIVDAKSHVVILANPNRVHTFTWTGN